MKATLYIHGGIGDEITADAIDAQLRNLPPTATLTVDLDSPGGSVLDSYRIMQAILPWKPTGLVTGVAASGASIIAMGCARLFMVDTAKMMVHRAACTTDGDCDSHTKAAEVLRELDRITSELYEARTGMPASHWQTTIARDRWYGAREAIEVGLADGIASGTYKPARAI